MLGRLKGKREKDYKGRCGNCHEILGEKDKYCRYCGTERGKGKFEPYENEMYCVYGPPVKRKYKCMGCGYIWITSALGGDNSKYCPQCGKNVLKVLEDKNMLRFGSRAIGYEEPYEEENRPVLFTEDQILGLIEQRETDGEEGSRTHRDISRKRILEALGNVGIRIPDEIDYPMTEKEGEQINLANIILQLAGSNPKGVKKVACPHCGGEEIAAIGYEVLGKEYNRTGKEVHAEAEEDALIYHGYGSIVIGGRNRRYEEGYPAYVCLRCGKEFGRIEVTEEMVGRSVE